jgi:hypothetical protein
MSVKFKEPFMVDTPLGKGLCMFLGDDEGSGSLWGVWQSTTQEMWWWPNDLVRLAKAISFKRHRQSAFLLSPEMYEHLLPHAARHGVTLPCPTSTKKPASA